MRRMQILVVEDNPVDRMFVEQALTNTPGFDYELIHADRLSTALELAGQKQFDAILLDLWLPDCEGLETCTQVLAQCGDVPVVVMTSAEDNGLAEETLRHGAQDYLIKGSFPGYLIGRILKYATDRQQFRHEIIQQRAKLQALLDRVPAIVWTMDVRLTITSCVGAGLRTLGLQPNQVVGMTLDQFLANDIMAQESLSSHRRALDGEQVAYEAGFRGRTYEVRVEPLRQADNQVQGVIGVALDITDQIRLDREIRFARLVQEGMLPAHQPQFPGYDIFGCSLPARMTCGDWFDYQSLPDGTLAIIVGDVSGKGFGAAVLGAAAEAYVQALAQTESQLDEILQVGNRLLCRHAPHEGFAVLSVVELLPTERRLRYAAAGDQLLVLGADGNLKARLGACGPPLGMVESAVYTGAHEMSLLTDDIVLMLTDGFREAAGTTELFGERRILEIVARYRSQPAREILERLCRAACEFATADHERDDMTGVIIKVL